MKVTKGVSENSDASLADVFEAYIGALFLDQGLMSCSQFCDKFLLPEASKSNILKPNIPELVGGLRCFIYAGGWTSVG